MVLCADLNGATRTASEEDAGMSRQDKSLEQAIRERRSTPSFDGTHLPVADLKRILGAGLLAPSGFNLQPWRFVVVQSAEQKKKLRAASYNQAKVEEASAVIVACGDADGWRKDMEEMLRLGRQNGMTEVYAQQAQSIIPNLFSNFSAEQMKCWLAKQVMIALTQMMLMAEAMDYDTAVMEGFEAEKVSEVLRLPMSYSVVAMLAVGRLKGPDKFNGGRFETGHTVFSEEHGNLLP
jgi:nitroreductase